MPPNAQPSTSSLVGDIATSLNDANNVLVTVAKDPTLDQLAACIGLTLALNKKDKHATAVFSGEVPSVIDFLEPDKTIEKNTDSLRDFIISLDKSKADKLRYKVEDSVVKIFITPYKTSITSEDLEFSQGDFNVDAVVALGVHNRAELDAAIVAHGRILHDAVIISVNNGQESDLGSLNWNEPGASSLSELVADLVQNIDEAVFDEQIATALLTGIVAETDRFRNEKASPHTMTVSGILMAAGANNQLVSSKLEEPAPEPEPEPELEPEPEPEQPEESAPEEAPADQPKEESSPEKAAESAPEAEKPAKAKDNDGVIQIDHDPNDIHIDDTGRLAKMSEIIEEARVEADPDAVRPVAATKSMLMTEAPKDPELHLPEPTVAPGSVADAPAEQPQVTNGPSMIYEPPTFGGQLTANTEATDRLYTHAPDPLTTPAVATKPHGHNRIEPSPPSDDTQGGEGPQTLSDLEKSVNSPHVMQYQETPAPSPPAQPAPAPVQQIDPAYASEAVERAVAASNDYRPEPIHALGAQPLGNDFNQQPQPVQVGALPGQPGTPPAVPPPLPTSSPMP